MKKISNITIYSFLVFFAVEIILLIIDLIKFNYSVDTSCYIIKSLLFLIVAIFWGNRHSIGVILYNILFVCFLIFILFNGLFLKKIINILFFAIIDYVFINFTIKKSRRF